MRKNEKNLLLFFLVLVFIFIVFNQRTFFVQAIIPMPTSTSTPTSTPGATVTPTATPCTCDGQPLGTRRCSGGTALEVCDDAYQPPPCSWHYYPCATGVCDPNPTPHCVEPTGTPIIPIAPED